MRIWAKIRVWVASYRRFLQNALGLGVPPPEVSLSLPKSVKKEPPLPVEDFEFEATVQAPLSQPWLKGEIIQEMQRFIQTQRSIHTRRAYENDLKQYVSYLRGERAAGDNFDTLLAYREWLVRPEYEGGKGLSRGSANRKFATIRSFLNWLQARGKVKENPSLWVKNFRARTESPTQAFSDIEVADMLSRPNLHSSSGLMHGVILNLLFYLGLRRGELVALEARHLGWARAGDSTVLTLRVPGKGDKERILPVPVKIQALLERYLLKKGLEIGGQGYLFSPVKNNLTKVKDKPLASQAIYYIVKKYALMAGVDRRVSPHSCRATCISNALDHSASHRSVQQLAGWSSPLMIERYDKRRTDLKDSAVHVVEY
jgi:integrase/recombinase XerD